MASEKYFRPQNCGAVAQTCRTTRSNAGRSPDYHDFTMQIRTRTKLDQLGNALLEPLFSVARGIRLLGVSLSSLAEEQAEREPEFGLPR